MIDFSLTVCMQVRMVLEHKIFLFEHHPWYGTLDFPFAHDLQQDAPVSMQNGIQLLYHNGRCFPKVDMVVVFALHGAEQFITSAHKDIATYLTFHAFLLCLLINLPI